MSDRVLLDTSVVIELENLDLGDFRRAIPLVSAISVAELAYGLDADDPIERQLRTERFQSVLNELVVLPFGITAARHYGTAAALVRRAGRNPRSRRMDLQIAATAAAHSLPVITRNPADFAHLERLVRVVAV